MNTPTDWWMEGRDDYGRATRTLYRIIPARSVEALGVVVTLPRRTAHARPAGQNYLTNDWTRPPGEGITYHRTLTAAKAHLEAAHSGVTR